jgi:hypothetical protein
VQLLVTLLGTAAALGCIALLCAVHLELELRALGDPSGAFAIAFGATAAGVVVSAARASAVPWRVEVHAFGRRWGLPSRWRRGDPARAERRKRARPAERDAARPSPLTRWSGWLDRPGSVALLRSLGRRVSIEELFVEAAFDFRDILLTGRVSGVLYAVSGILPGSVTLVQRPGWEGAERWELTGRGRVALWPGLALGAVLWYMLRAPRMQRAQGSGHPPRPTPAAQERAG